MKCIACGAPTDTRLCPACGGEMFIREHILYGADADGNRGVKCPVFLCSSCGCEIVELR